MPDQRAVTALSRAWFSAREILDHELRRAGYDPDALAVLPDPGSCACSLGRAIRTWQDIDRRLTAAERTPSGWRF